MALDATIGGESANSYQDVAEAQLYFDNQLYSTAWETASDGNKEKALIMACLRLEQEEYIGDKVTTTQALKWPRLDWYRYGYGFALTDLNGNGYDSTSIPKPVKYAQCEVALSLLQSDIFSAGELGKLQALDLGPIKLDFSGVNLSGLPAAAMRYLRGILITTAKVVRS